MRQEKIVKERAFYTIEYSIMKRIRGIIYCINACFFLFLPLP
jgi:hypothetical protein